MYFETQEKVSEVYSGHIGLQLANTIEIMKTVLAKNQHNELINL